MSPMAPSTPVPALPLYLPPMLNPDPGRSRCFLSLTTVAAF